MVKPSPVPHPKGFFGVCFFVFWFFLDRLALDPQHSSFFDLPCARVKSTYHHAWSSRLLFCYCCLCFGFSAFFVFSLEVLGIESTLPHTKQVSELQPKTPLLDFPFALCLQSVWFLLYFFETRSPRVESQSSCLGL